MKTPLHEKNAPSVDWVHNKAGPRLHSERFEKIFSFFFFLQFKWTSHYVILPAFTPAYKINSHTVITLKAEAQLISNRYVNVRVMIVHSVNFDNSPNHRSVTFPKSNNLPLREIHLLDSWTAQHQSFPGMADKYSHERGAKAKTKYPCQLKRHSHLLSPDSHI